MVNGFVKYEVRGRSKFRRHLSRQVQFQDQPGSGINRRRLIPKKIRNLKKISKEKLVFFAVK